MLILKKDKSSGYVIFWKSKLLPLHGAFLSNVKRFGYKIRIEFNKTILVVGQKDYATKIVNFYIIFDLENWPTNPLSIFSLKNSLFGATNVEKTVRKVCV